MYRKERESMTEKNQVKRQYIDMCGAELQRCCYFNPDCLQEIRILNGKPVYTGQCCVY